MNGLCWLLHCWDLFFHSHSEFETKQQFPLFRTDAFLRDVFFTCGRLLGCGLGSHVIGPGTGRGGGEPEVRRRLPHPRPGGGRRPTLRPLRCDPRATIAISGQRQHSPNHRELRGPPVIFSIVKICFFGILFNFECNYFRRGCVVVVWVGVFLS